MRQLIMCLLFFLASLTANAKDLPNFSAVFDVSMAGIPAGQSIYSLDSNPDGSYTLKTVSYATGIFKALFSGQYILTSEFQIDQGNVKPLTFKDQKTGDDESLSQRFDWHQYIAHINNEKGAKNLKIKAGTQDVLSYHIKLAESIREGKTEFSYPVVVGRKLKTYQIRVLGHETLDTELGPIETIKITRLQDDKRKTYVWVAPKLNYIPVQAKHIESGITFMAELSDLKGLEGLSAFNIVANQQ